MLKRLAIDSLRIQNLFSFGEEGAKVELGPLNLLIGPNASGKSNFIEAIGLLKGLPDDFAEAVAAAGDPWGGSPGGHGRSLGHRKRGRDWCS